MKGVRINGIQVCAMRHVCFNVEAARQLVATQDNNPLLDVATLPFEDSFEIARASHKGGPGKPTVM